MKGKSFYCKWIKFLVSVLCFFVFYIMKKIYAEKVVTLNIHEILLA